MYWFNYICASQHPGIGIRTKLTISWLTPPAGMFPHKDKHERLLAFRGHQEARWVEHLKEILNRPPPEVKPETPKAEEDLSGVTEPPNHS